MLLQFTYIVKSYHYNSLINIIFYISHVPEPIYERMDVFIHYLIVNRPQL
jgi:hypothetical protein